MATLTMTVTDAPTGFVRPRKVRTTDAIAVFDIMSVRRVLPDDRRASFLRAMERLTVYIDPDTLQVGCFRSNNNLAVRLTVKEQRRGERLFWVCPRSGKAASLLYLLQTDKGPVIGSREGLGLSYPSQALHRTPLYDAAVYIGQLKTTRKVYHRVAARKQRRHSKGLKRLAREFG